MKFRIRRLCQLLVAAMLVPSSMAQSAPRLSPELSIAKASEVAIEVDASAEVRDALPTNLFGFNLNYRSFQAQLLSERSSMPPDRVLEDLAVFAGAIYRYPGGLIANGFDWTEAIGDYAQRSPQRTIFGARPEPARFGVGEYLEFLDRVDGRPLYVLNLLGVDGGEPNLEADIDVVAERAGELAEYLRQNLNDRTQNRLYQLGNELDRAEYEWSPAKYVERSRAVIDAVHEADPSARVIAFLRDFVWRYRLERDRAQSDPEDFMADVLAGLPEVRDFSLHHYYDGEREDGKTRTLPFWLERTERMIDTYKRIRGGESPGVWITEHARAKSSDKPNQDLTKVYTSNLGGALSASDYLIALAQVPEIAGACWHGLNAGPWQLFDATVLYGDLRPRPIYWALRLLRTSAEGSVLSTRTRSPNRSGYAGGYDTRAVAFRSDSDKLTLWAINRASTPQPATIRYQPFASRTLELRVTFVGGAPNMDPDDLKHQSQVISGPRVSTVSADQSGRIGLELPPAAIAVVELRASAAAHVTQPPPASPPHG